MRSMTLLAAVLAAPLAASLPASAATIVTSAAAFRAAAAGVVTASANPGNYDLTLLTLPTTASITLGDAGVLTLSNAAQVTQPQNGYPYLFTDGFAGELFVPQDSSGNQVSSETISFGRSVSALGFEVAPFSALQGAPNFGVKGGSYSITFAAGGASTTVLLPGGDENTGLTTSQFIGFVGGGLTSITLTTSDPNGFAFGNFLSVPEPASAAILLVGLAAVMRSRRFRPASPGGAAST